ncbi:amino acid ABC transporter permease [Eoetvoesiella caeni]|uniref:Glutamate/aspartate import permease protein GltK n=1 Tax=Eoetvoesiella caeni TaxID=645616 RepID=A0A366H2U6_9BURK|nr:amino acid ABC transporter permease [Eoetvoesiella caeni]MCI2810621.1 amino acid ABC transporter permease [Eoetvoesiella caeni]NYT56595.1 amino acid ABC transporter permease [Eoetvoesiella caeni]RBP36244.1 L-glutamate ABC transporter membrane protein /L-aspartate ABC transporter membrane protein [Eoetvoesiella caeni]
MHGFDFEIIIRTAPYLFTVGLMFTLKLTVLSTIGAIILGTLLAIMRLSSNRAVSAVAGGYVNLMRALPLILIIFWFYFLVPYIVGWLTQAGRPIAVGGFTSALITFTLFEAAYFCEIVRAGIQSVPRGQLDAGYAVGLSFRQVMSYVVLPQAFRKMTPLLLTQVIVIFQDTSLVYVLSLTDFLGAANNVAQRDGRLVEMFVFAAVVYFLISYAASRSVKMLERRSNAAGA